MSAFDAGHSSAGSAAVARTVAAMHAGLIAQLATPVPSTGPVGAGLSAATAAQRNLPWPPKSAAVATPQSSVDLAAMRQSMNELTEEIRSERLRRSEFRFVTMLAGLCQLLAILLGLLGLVQLGNFEIFARWMMGAALLQLLTLTLLVLDLRG
jgi:hypothetical protein